MKTRKLKFKIPIVPSERKESFLDFLFYRKKTLSPQKGLRDKINKIIFSSFSFVFSFFLKCSKNKRLGLVLLLNIEAF